MGEGRCVVLILAVSYSWSDPNPAETFGPFTTLVSRPGANMSMNAISPKSTMISEQAEFHLHI